ncbi:probable serine hydrolase [Diorhabda carinulata]|uniref:probable serine hydrolase n=1 Tax=Diorhabda sublineata TaxID=1163346 RepID=UPI0024E14771|nr:probable serine hydrolase [Diorhabda sublineata]XP_057671235.1 probable serine hydrolase [Diorhabda carinulata]
MSKITAKTGPSPDTNDFQEVEVPVPWGKICGKWYGPRNVQPILAIHGWQDNCGTFDRLAPIIQKEGFPIFCIDLPGHGYSTPYPKGLVYNHWYDGVYIIRRLVKFFGWKKITIIGHSLGGGMAYLYASTYPDEVEKFVSFDNCSPSFRNPKKVLGLAAANIDKLFDYEKGSEDSLCYDYPEMLNIFIEGHHGSLDVDSAEMLLRRGLKPSPDKENCFAFTRDPRLKIDAFTFFTIDKLLDFSARITCEVLNIRADDGMKFDMDEFYDHVLDPIESSSKRFERVVVEGKHHVHLTGVDIVAPIVLNFLKTSAD